MPPPIKFPARNDPIQPFCNVANCATFYKGAVLCNSFIFFSPNIVTRNLVSFRLFFSFVVILFSEESLLRDFFTVENIVGTAPFSSFTGFVFKSSVLKQGMLYKFYIINLGIKYL